MRIILIYLLFSRLYLSVIFNPIWKLIQIRKETTKIKKQNKTSVLHASFFFTFETDFHNPTTIKIATIGADKIELLYCLQFMNLLLELNYFIMHINMPEEK